MPGRHPKTNLDYFPLYCSLGDKFKFLEAQCGLIGFAIVIKLFQKIYGERGYYCEFNERKAMLLAPEWKTGKDTVIKVVNVSVSEGIFSEEMYKKYGILTSERIQLNYLEGTSRRIGCEILPEYALVDCAQILKNVDINSNYANENEENANNNQQKKEEERKVIKKESSFSFSLSEKNDSSSSDTELPLDKVKISPAELESLKSLLSSDDLKYYLSVIADNESRGHSYTKRSHYEAVIDMAKADGKIKVPKKAKERPQRKTKYAGFNAEDALMRAMERSYGNVK